MELFLSYVQAHSLIISSLILVIAYVLIAIEVLPKVTIALAGASLTLALGLLSQHKEVVSGELNPLYFINFVDFKVIFLLISMMIIVSIATRSGVFNWMANKMLQLTQGKPKVVFCALAVFTAIASAFLDNVTTVILIMPITFVIAKELDINPIPFLVAEIISSNIGGTATLIGDPPNIIIGSIAGLSFMDFIVNLTFIVALIMIVVTLVLLYIFRKQLVSTEEKMEHVKNIDNSNSIKDKKLMIRSVGTLFFVILGFVFHSVTHIDTYLMAMIGASFLLLFEKPQDILHEVEWNTIFFFIGLFIIIGGFEASGGIKLMAQGLLDITNGSQAYTAMIMIWASGILSGIIDNIPYTATMAPMLLHIKGVMGAAYTEPLWWCLSLGACLGGNMTIIGAAANVIVSETAHANGHQIKFMWFLKYGVLVTLISLVMSTVFIYFRYMH